MADNATGKGVKIERGASALRAGSIGKKLYKHDVMGSIAHVTALGELGLITSGDAEVLQRALTRIFYDVTSDKIAIPAEEDLFDFLDNELKTRVGELGEKVNVARTRDDRTALDVRMYVRDAAGEIAEYVKTAVQTLVSVAEVNTLTFMPASYGEAEGQPTTAAHSLLARAEAFLRDGARIKKVIESTDGMPLYSAYGTGLRLPVDKKRVAELLRFKTVAYNTADAVADTDYIRELLFAVAVFADHAEAIANDVREYVVKGYATLPENFTVPSEARILNVLPVGADALITSARALSSLCREAFRNAPILDLCLCAIEAESSVKALVPALNELVAALSFDAQASLKAAQIGYPTAADCIDYLVAKGENKSSALGIVTKLCVYCRDNSKRLDTLPVEIYTEFSDKFGADVVSDMRIRNAVRLRKNDGEPSDVSTRAEIRSLNRRITKVFDKD